MITMDTPLTITAEDTTVGPDATAVKVLHFDGQFNELNVDEQAKKLYDIIATLHEGSILLFDFSNLKYMNSRSIGYLMECNNRIEQLKSRLIIVAPRENIADILSLVGITKLVPLCVNLESVPAVLAQRSSLSSSVPSVN